MGIFSSIKNAIFGTKDEGQAPAATSAIPMSTAAAQPAPAQPMVEVDVEANLSARPGADKLNWSTSIVDLMKLLGIDSSYANRKALAEELGNTSYEGSAEDNIGLHKAVMKALAANGGKVPAAMLD
jgi:Domain of unknown function (DUF3597)